MLFYAHFSNEANCVSICDIWQFSEGGMRIGDDYQAVIPNKLPAGMLFFLRSVFPNMLFINLILYFNFLSVKINVYLLMEFNVSSKGTTRAIK